MNITTLNMTTLDGGVIIKRGGGSTPSKPKWTGHADAEGLKAIGWTDEDIAYYQQYGVNWNEEDDEWNKVTDDNKALYGVLTASNISSYRDRIVYLPKIDTSGVTSMSSMFQNCYSLTAIPLLDTSGVTSMSSMFQNCILLTTIPQLDTSGVTIMSNMFDSCYSLTTIPMLDTSNVTSMSSMFKNCHSLSFIPHLNCSNCTSFYQLFYECNALRYISKLESGNITSTYQMLRGCYSLYGIKQLDMGKVTNTGAMMATCMCLVNAYFKNLACNITIGASFLSKDSLLYIINNEAATSAITIKLESYAYDKWATDPDVVAALANHPNISLAK